MQAVNRGATEDALRLIDESHGHLLDARRTFQAVEAANDRQLHVTVSQKAGPSDREGCHSVSAHTPRRDAEPGPQVITGRNPGPVSKAHPQRRGARASSRPFFLRRVR
jgi:hypothetical protein